MVDNDGDQEPCPAQCAEYERTDRRYAPENHTQLIFDLAGIPVGKICRDGSEYDGDEREDDKEGKNEIIWHCVGPAADVSAAEADVYVLSYFDRRTRTLPSPDSMKMFILPSAES